MLADIFQDLLCNRDDYLRAVRALMREIVKAAKHDFNFTEFALGLMEERDFHSLEPPLKVRTHDCKITVVLLSAEKYCHVVSVLSLWLFLVLLNVIHFTYTGTCLTSNFGGNVSLCVKTFYIYLWICLRINLAYIELGNLYCYQMLNIIN